MRIMGCVCETETEREVIYISFGAFVWEFCVMRDKAGLGMILILFHFFLLRQLEFQLVYSREADGLQRPLSYRF
jgi:hypothetical protein